MENLNEFIAKYFEEHEKEIFADLKYLVSYPSVISDPVPGAPFGKDCDDCLKAAMALYEREGFKTETFSESGYGLAYFDNKPENGEKYQVVLTHSDVVPVVPEDWTMTSPFDMFDNGEFVFGRGVADDKHAVIGLLYIMKAYKAAGFVPNHPITVFVGANEETGMKDIRNFKKEQPLPAVGVAPDGAYPVSFGERGSFRAFVISKNELKDVLSIQGGNVVNTVMGALKCTIKKNDKLVATLTENKPEWLEFEVKDDVIELTAQGVSCHGARPQNGDSALRRTAEFLAANGNLCESDTEIFAQIADILSDCNGIAVGIANTDPDMGKLTAANGKVNFENNKIIFSLDIRFGPTCDKEETKAILGADLDRRGFILDAAKGGVSFKIDPESRLAKVFLDSFRKYSGNPEAKFYYMSGGTYSKVLNPECPCFSTGVAYGKIGDRLSLPKGHGGAHASDEVLGKKEYLRGLTILGSIIADLDEAY